MEGKNTGVNVKPYLFDRREGFITRWHAQYTHRQESLAEHQFFVTRNVLFLCRVLRELAIAYPSQSVALSFAVNHDQAEKIIGDVSGYTKRIWPELKHVMNDIEADVIENSMFNNMPSEMKEYYRVEAEEAAKKETIESQIVGYADLLDAYIFAKQENLLGNIFMLQSIQDLEGFLKKLQWPWLQELREQTDLP